MRDTQLLSIRPKIALETAKSTPEEQFQNLTLRPILKLQHPLLIAAFQKGTQKHHKVLQNLPQPARQALVAEIIRSDHRLRQLLIGMVIGQFTADEYAVFTQNEAPLMRRLIALLVQRLQSEM